MGSAASRPSYGGKDGWLINHKAVARHMREMGLQAVAPGPNLSKRGYAQAAYPYLLRDVTAAYPIMCGGLTSRTSASKAVGCIWSRRQRRA